MIYYLRKHFVLVACLGIVAFCFEVQAQDDKTTRKFMAAKLAYQDLQSLECYYGDNSQVASTMETLRPMYVDACITAQLLVLVRLAQNAISQLREPEFGCDRFNDFLIFLEAGNRNTDYLRMLELLEKAEFQKLAKSHSFFVLVLMRWVHAVGLGSRSPIAALREEAQGVIQDSFFMNNRSDLLQIVREIFEDPREGDPLVRIQNIIDRLTDGFTRSALGFFDGIHQFIPTLMAAHLPPEYRDNETARGARLRLYAHAIHLQEALLDPAHWGRGLDRGSPNADLRAGVGSSSFLSARL